MRCLSLAFLLCFGLLCEAQKYDNTWLWGTDPQYQNTIPFRGNAEAVFPGNQFSSYAQFRNTVFDYANTSFSDVNGDLQFFTNGMRIRGADNNVLVNGDSLNFSSFWQYCKSTEQGGAFSYYVPYSHFAVPKPGNDSFVYLFHIRGDTTGVEWKGSVCYSIIEKKNGHWIVSLKNKVLSLGKAAYGGITACKHANGRDWWFAFTDVQSNCVNLYLLNNDTLTYASTQCNGDSIDQTDVVKEYFSQDGSKYVRTSSNHGTDVFDFNRCDGSLIFSSHVAPVFVIDTANGNIIGSAVGSELSSTNSYLYLNTTRFVVQYDLQAANVEGSKDTVGVIDYFQDTLPGTGGTYFFFLTQYGPDGKIYIGPKVGCRWMSTIDFPDSGKASCHLGVRSTALPKLNNNTLSYFPNYRLGRLTGSACDTVYSDVKPIYTQTPWLKVFPNPTANDVQFDYNWIEWEKVEDLKLKIEDLQGRVVLERELPRYSTRQNFSVKELAAGVYTVSLRSSSPFCFIPSVSAGRGSGGERGNVIAVCKLTKVQ